MIERAEGTDLIDVDGARYIDGVSSLWCNVHGHRHPRDRPGGARPARPGRPLDHARPHPSRRRRARRAPGRDRPARAEPRLLLGLGLDRGRDRAEDGVPVLAAARRRSTAAHLVRLPARRLPRRHVGAVSVGGIDLFHAAYRPLLFKAHRVEPGDAGDIERAARRRTREEIAAVIVEPLVQGAAGIASSRPGTCAGARAHARPRRAADLRRGRDRVRPHRDDVRLRAGARRARLPLPRQGAHRRLPAARGHADHRARLRGLPRRRRRKAAPSSTATPSPATRSPAPPRSPTSRSSSARGRCVRLQPKIRAARRAARRVAELPEVAEVRGRGFMAGIDLGEHDPALRLGHRVTLEARRRGRDRAPARRHGRPDAAAGDPEARPAAPGRDRRRGDPGGLRLGLRRRAGG